MMHIAYIISAYKNPEQLIRLILRLCSEQTTFLVHVDKKADREIYNRIVEGTRHLLNVHFLKRYDCYWGEFGHVQASLEGIRELMKRKISFDYALLLTGQDYPIKTNAQIQDFLQQHKGESFLANFPLPSKEWEDGGLERVERWYVRWYGGRFVFPKNGYSFIKRKFPKGLLPFGGSSYWCLTKECIEYIDHFVRTHSRFIRFFKYVDVPDEIFFQTILMNSAHAENIINDDLRYIDWKDPNSGSPAVLSKTDLSSLLVSQKLFARKFDVNVELKILDLIDQMIFYHTRI
jgi:Core-2/I-Branching enzyme